MKNYKILFLTPLLLIYALSFGQAESDFYTPQSGGVTKNLKLDYGVDNNFSTDDSQKLQQAINDVSKAGGGRIVIPAGSYSFAKVLMKSNVRLEIDKEATIRPAHVSSGNYSIFDMGKKQPTIRNVSIKGIGGQFKVDLRNVSNPSVFVFTLSNVDNFEIANFYIYDKNTTFQSVGLGHTTYNNVHYVPQNGVIKNGHANNTNYGYGLVQVQAGEHILFKDLSGTGGVTLRLESGWDVMNKIQPASKTPKIKDIYGRNISCSNGQAAVFLSPHTINQGKVDIRDVTGDACEFVVKTEKGFVDQSKYSGLNLSPGSFSSSSVISNVKATYGDKAEVRSICLRFIPCNLRSKIGAFNNAERMYPAPACAPVGDIAGGLWRGIGPNGAGSYKVQFSKISGTGFASSVPDIVNGDNCDYEDCAAVNGFNVWIPKESRGTSGQCGGTEIEDSTINELTSISGPATIAPGEKATISVNYSAREQVDIKFQLIRKNPWTVLINNNVTENAGNGSASSIINVPSNAAEGAYLWRAWITPSGAGWNGKEDDISKDVTVSASDEEKSFVDFFQPMEIQAPLVNTGTWGVNGGIWGDPNVSPRDIANGLEDATTKSWCYWDGQIVKDDVGKYHMYASRWSQSYPHSTGWKEDSKGIHAVSDNIMGPYDDKGLVYPNWNGGNPDWQNGRGHNVIGLRMHDGRYAVISSEITPGDVFVSDSPDGPFEYLGQIQYDCNGFSCGWARYNFEPNHMSNVMAILRHDGRYMIVPRSTVPMISDNGILGPYKIMNEPVYKDHPELPQDRNEDPTVWYSGGLYHILYNHWPTSTMYHFTSEDGINNWVYRGVAMEKEKDKIFKYTNGVVNDWEIIQRPTAYVENGHVTHFLFSVIDVHKGSDGANDNHASKIVVVPFDGEAFDCYMKNVIRKEKGLALTDCTDDEVRVTGVNISPASESLLVGGTQQLTANVSPPDATNKSVSWSSNNTGVATVSNSGLVTAKAAGNAVITVTTQDGNKTAISTITVNNEDKNELTDISGPATISPGENATISANYTAKEIVDIKFQLIQKNPWTVIVNSNVTKNAGNGTASSVMNVPANAAEGAYLWRAWITPSGAGWNGKEDEISKDVTVSASEEEKSFVDFFQPMEIQAPLVNTGTWGVNGGIWGDPNVSPRDIANGLEDARTKSWCYWDGKIVKDDVGKYHIYASRWSQSYPHSTGWKEDSKAIHAVSDNIMGPYEDKGLVYPNWNGGNPDWQYGRGSNVIGIRMHDGRYAVISSEITPGDVFVSDSPDGPFEYLGQIQYDCNGFSCGWARYNFEPNHMSNVKVILRHDGRYMIIPRSTVPMISDNGILGPYKIMNEPVYKDHPELPQDRNEDPSVWYSGGLYHIVYNHWPTATMHHFTSEDGIYNWVYRGVALEKEKDKIFKYTNGIINDWEFIERPTAYVENGHVTHFIFSVIDVHKGSDGANDNHASKIVVVPFDGEAFDCYMENIIRKEKGLPVTDCNDDEVKVTGVSVSPTSESLLVGGTRQLTANVSPPNATNKTVSWSSNNTGVATVSNSGLVTAKAEGNAIITVTTHDGGKKATSTITVTGAGSGILIPGKVEAEDYTSMNGIQTQNTSDAGGGENVGWIETGDWMDYKVNVQSAGTYTVKFRLASLSNNIQLDLKKGNTVLTSVNATTTNGWQSWKTVSKTVNLAAGEQIIRILATGPSWNINWIEFSKSSTGEVITYQAEGFINTSGTYNDASAGGPGLGVNRTATMINYVNSGDWADYNISIPEDGEYEIVYYISSPVTGSTIIFGMGTTVWNTTTVPNNGSWDNYQPLKASQTANFTKGNHIVRLSAGAQTWTWNLDKFTLQRVGAMKKTENGLTAKNELKLYPNPASDFLNLQFSKEVNATMYLYNTNGIAVNKDHIDGNYYKLPISELPSGLYILQIVNGDETIVQRIIKE